MKINALLILLFFFALFSLSANSEAYYSNETLSERCDAGSSIFCAVLELREYEDSDGIKISQDTIAHFTKKCETSAKYCYSLWAAYSSGEGVEPDTQLAEKFAVLACKKDYPLGCFAEGQSVRHSASNKAEYESRFSQANSRACSLGLADGCLYLFNFYYKQSLTIKNIGDKAAIEYLQRACLLEDYDTCYKLAEYYWKGHTDYSSQSFPKDNELAIEYYDQACIQGVGESCSSLGSIFSGDLGNDYLDLKRAVNYFEKACNLGALGCMDLSRYYREGNDRYPTGPKKDLALANKYEIMSCEKTL